MAKKNLSPEVREYFQRIGRERGNALKAKYGSNYFREIAAKRKTFGKRPVEKNSVTELSKRFSVSRQRMYQILETNKTGIRQEDFGDMGLWREAVILSHVASKKDSKKIKI